MANETIQATITYTTPRGKNLSLQTTPLVIEDTSVLAMTFEFMVIPTAGYAAGVPVPEIHINVMNTARFKINNPSTAFLNALSSGLISVSFILPNGGSGTGFDTFSGLTESYRHVVNGSVVYVLLDFNIRAIQDPGREIQFILRNGGSVIYTTESYWNEYQGDYILKPGARIQLEMIAGGGAGGNIATQDEDTGDGTYGYPPGNGGSGFAPSAYFYYRPNISYVIGNVYVEGGRGGGGGSSEPYLGGDPTPWGMGGPGAGGALPNFDTATFQNYFDWWTGSNTWFAAKGKDAVDNPSVFNQPQQGAVNDQQPAFGYGGDGAYDANNGLWTYGGAGGAGARFHADMTYLASRPNPGMISTRTDVRGGLVSSSGNLIKGTGGGRGLYNLTITDALGTRSISI